VSSVGDPPGISFVLGRNGIVQVLTVMKSYLFVHLAMNDHDGTFHIFDVIDIGIDIQTSQQTKQKEEEM